MRKRRNQHKSATMQQPWLIIFSDLMTLMLTFFVILVAMSVIDENSRQRAVESVRHVFGFEDSRYRLDKMQDAEGVVNPGQSASPSSTAHEAAQLLFKDSPSVSVRYTEQEFIVSALGDMLFREGSNQLTVEGRRALDRLVPFMQDIKYPVRIEAHSAPGVGEGSLLAFSGERVLDASWELSMQRGMAVREHFITRGVPGEMLVMEAYGSHRPHYSNNSADGRRKNRRVDLVLDRRNPALRGAFESMRPQPGEGQEYYFRDFRFDLDMPAPSAPHGEGAR